MTYKGCESNFVEIFWMKQAEKQRRGKVTMKQVGQYKMNYTYQCFVFEINFQNKYHWH